MTFVALPVVPDDPIGPFGGVNPREIWLIAIILAGISFLGYAAVKFFGARHGVLIAAATGGLVSSTAVTYANARQAAAGKGSPSLLAAGVALSTTVSFLRVLAIALVLQPGLLWLLAPPLLAAGGIAAAYALVSAYGRSEAESSRQSVTFRNPFGFWSVVGFAIFLAGVILLARVLSETLGTTGVVAGALALGLADVDAITVSMSRLVPDSLAARSAAMAILAAVLSNTLSKMAIGAGLGRGRFALEIAAMSVASLVAAALALVAAFAFFPV